MNLIESINQLKQGILNRNWSTVWDAYKGLSGEDDPDDSGLPPIIEYEAKFPKTKQKVAKKPRQVRAKNTKPSKELKEALDVIAPSLPKNIGYETSTQKPDSKQKRVEVVGGNWKNTFDPSEYDIKDDPKILKKVKKNINASNKVARPTYQTAEVICGGCRKKFQVHPSLIPPFIGDARDGSQSEYLCDKCVARK